MRFGVLHQSLPLLLVHPLGAAGLSPVDILSAVGNQGDGSLDSDLQAILAMGQGRIFLTQETLDKLRKNFRPRLLGKEMGKDALERGPSMGDIGARQVAIQLKN